MKSGRYQQMELEIAIYCIIYKRTFWSRIINESTYGIKLFENKEDLLAFQKKLALKKIDIQYIFTKI